MKLLDWRLQALRFLLALFASLSVASVNAEDEAGWRLVNYWSEWCSPCRKEIPMLNALSEQLALNGVRLVGVNFDDDPRDVTLVIARSMGIEFPTLTREEVYASGMPAPSVMPTTYIVSPDNAVVDKLIGLQSREQVVARLSRLGLFSDSP